MIGWMDGSMWDKEGGDESIVDQSTSMWFRRAVDEDHYELSAPSHGGTIASWIKSQYIGMMFEWI